MSESTEPGIRFGMRMDQFSGLMPYRVFEILLVATHLRRLHPAGIWPAQRTAGAGDPRPGHQPEGHPPDRHRALRPGGPRPPGQPALRHGGDHGPAGGHAPRGVRPGSQGAGAPAAHGGCWRCTRGRCRRWRRCARPGEVDWVFLWLGDVKSLFAMLKQQEDRRNADHDVLDRGVRAIIVVEDDVRFYSFFLPHIYAEVTHQTSRLMAEGLNLTHRILRTPARPEDLPGPGLRGGLAAVRTVRGPSPGHHLRRELPPGRAAGPAGGHRAGPGRRAGRTRTCRSCCSPPKPCRAPWWRIWGAFFLAQGIAHLPGRPAHLHAGEFRFRRFHLPPAGPHRGGPAPPISASSWRSWTGSRTKGDPGPVYERRRPAPGGERRSRGDDGGWVEGGPGLLRPRQRLGRAGQLRRRRRLGRLRGRRFRRRGLRRQRLLRGPPGPYL